MNPTPQPDPLPDVGVDAQNPWPGLVAFTEGLRDYFHGRVDEAEDLLRRVDRKNLTVLFGQSGLGKSSLLQAGLFPRLRAAGYLPVTIRLDHAPLAPSLADQVTSAVRRALVEAGGRPEATATGPGDSLWEHLHRRDLPLQTADGRPIRPVLVFDQFEELFAIGQSSDEARTRASSFLTELADFVENRAPESLERRLEESPELVRQFVFDDRDYRVLVCLREDYLPHLEGIRRSMPSITENRMRLTRMDGRRALDAVTIPGGALIATEVGRQVVRFVAGGRLGRAGAPGATGEDDGLAEMEVEPSLLSLVCRELNNRRLANGLPQITSDLLAGNRNRILQDFYERCVADQSPEVRAFVEDELVTDSGLRENIALERARKALTARGAPATAIDVLVRRRLLHLEDRLDIQRVELTHDVLTSVVKKSRDERHQREATLRAETEAEAIREKARHQRKRLRAIVAGMAAALIVVSSFGVFSFYQWREAVRQKEQARLSREEAVREKEKAEKSQALALQRFDEKRQAMDNMLAQFGDKQLSGMPGTQQIRKILFQRGVELYEGMSRERQNDPAVQISLAERYVELGRLQSEIGTFEQAIEPLKKGEAVLRRLVEQEPTNRDYRFRLGVIVYQIGYCHWEHNKTGPGVPVLREAVLILGKLAEDEPKNFEYALHLAQARVRLGAIGGDALKEQEALYRTGYDSFKRLLAERPDDPRLLTSLARVADNLGFVAIDRKSDDKEGERFFEEARRMAQRSIEVDPTDQTTFNYLQAATQGLSRVYAKTGRLTEGIRLTSQAVADLLTKVNANPDVNSYQKFLVFALDDLRKLYQRSGEYEKAVDSLQEIVRISDALTRRDPQNTQHPIDSIDASQGISNIYRNTRREAEAAVILDKVIKQADQVMRLHPTSNDLLQKFLLAHQVRGEMSFNVEQYEKARETYQRGVDLFARFRPSIASLDEITQYNYFQCCCGLFLIAKEKKETAEAVALATRLIVPIRLETVTESDYKQTHLEKLINLSQLYEDTGNVREALRLRVLGVEESRKALGGDPKSNWYLYQQVFGGYQHLARLYRKVGDERHEFDAIRDHLRETEPYVRGRDHTGLLADTAEFNPRNLGRLRDTLARFSESGMKRFTVPTDFDGIKYPFHIYVTDSWQYLDDQFTWVEKVRGGKVPKDVIESFRRLYKIAKENNVSFMDLCVYALGTVDAVAKDDSDTPILLLVAKADGLVVSKELAQAKLEIQAGKGGAIARRRLALKYANLAQAEIATSNYARAASLLDESRTYISVDSLDRLRDPVDRDVFAYIQYVQGALLACTGAAEKGYSKILDSIRTDPGRVAPEFAIPAGNREFAMGWICTKLGRPAEAAIWYQKAMELGHRFGAGRLYLVCETSPQALQVVPGDLRTLFERAKGSATKNEAGPAAFARLIIEAKAKVTSEAALAESRRRNEQIAQLEDLAAQYHDLAAASEGKERRDALREALSKEYNVREQIAKLDPTSREGKTPQVEAAARLARSYRESQEVPAELLWTERAAALNHGDSLLLLADWYQKGTNVKPDPEKAGNYRYLGHYYRGTGRLRESRYSDALPDLLKASEFPNADAEDHDNLGVCYAKLGRWDEAVAAYTRSVELDVKGGTATGHILNALEALIVAEKPERLLALVEMVKAKGWTPPKEGARADEYAALYHGFRAMALAMSGKDASEAERAMREFTGKKGFAITGWTWDELDGGLKGSKLAPDRKAAVEKIVKELKGTATR